MDKIFISCPFIKYISENRFVNEKYKNFTELLYNTCLNYSNDVFMALKRENYGEKPSPRYSCKMDMDELVTSDVAIILPDDSMGVAVEIGWASALNKKIILILNIQQEYSTLVKNIGDITECYKVYYQTEEIEVIKEIERILAKWR